MNNINSIDYFKILAKNKGLKQADTKLVNQETSSYDSEFIMNYANEDSVVLDLGTGTGMIVNRYYSKVKKIIAVEIFEEFTQFIVKSSNIQIINTSLFDYAPEINGGGGGAIDLLTIFGTMHYFNEEEAIAVYQKYFQYLKAGGKILVKNQFGIHEDVTISGFSEELQKMYFAQYRHIEKEVKIIGEAGYRNIEIIDIYPPEFNKWDNTHYFAIVATK